MSVTLSEANAAIGSIDSAYYGVILKGFNMPKRKSSIITSDYLFQNQKIRSKIRLDDPKSQLWEHLQNIQMQKSWGFDESHLPNIAWMINVLYTLIPNHQIFNDKIYECKSQLTEDELRLIQSFNTSIGRSKYGRFLKRTKVQVQANKNLNIQIKQQLKSNKIQEKEKKIEALKLQIENLKENLIQEEFQS